MSRALREQVRDRAGGRCEYCHLPDFAAPASDFHVEHIIARQHRGSDEADNRCWCCHHCNLHKGPNLSGIDPETGSVVRLFNPRQDVWEIHFEFRGALIVGRTPEGRATADVCNMNAPRRVRLRKQLLAEGKLE